MSGPRRRIRVPKRVKTRDLVVILFKTAQGETYKLKILFAASGESKGRLKLDPLFFPVRTIDSKTQSTLCMRERDE
jgi:hypothetical protein